jgi:hypothetical protein
MTMIDHLIQSTKVDTGDHKKLAFLYDIGCNIEKGIIRVSIPNFLLQIYLSLDHAEIWVYTEKSIPTREGTKQSTIWH